MILLPGYRENDYKINNKYLIIDNILFDIANICVYRRKIDFVDNSVSLHKI